MWLNKPPTRRFFERTFELMRSDGLPRSGIIGRTLFSHIVTQQFIGRRSRLRWWMHQLIFWGCILAVAITFPLVFGWIHFGSARDDQ